MLYLRKLNILKKKKKSFNFYDEKILNIFRRLVYFPAKCVEVEIKLLRYIAHLGTLCLSFGEFYWSQCKGIEKRMALLTNCLIKCEENTIAYCVTSIFCMPCILVCDLCV